MATIPLNTERSSADATDLPDDLRRVRLVGKDLRGVDLSGRDLSGADLSRADLRGARLLLCNLKAAILTETRLEEAELAGADLSEATLDGAHLERAGLGRCDLSGASLFGAHADGASFVDAKLTGADLRTLKAEGARWNGADFTGAELARADLRESDLSGVDARNASFMETDLRGVRLAGLRNFESASFLRSDIRKADFTCAYLLKRQIGDENYLHEFKNRDRLHRAIYWLWWLSSNCGRSLARWGLWTVFTAFIFGLAQSMVDVDYGDHETWLSPFYYSVVTLTSLGYGDVLPTSAMAQGLSMVEVMTGYMLLGGMISIFSNKLARRAE